FRLDLAKDFAACVRTGEGNGVSRQQERVVHVLWPRIDKPSKQLPAQIVTTCTERKRFAIPPELRASSLPLGSIQDLASEWNARVGATHDCHPALKTYCGRSFQEAVAAAKALGVDLRVISAGLGLVEASRSIPAYGLTLVRGADDEIMSRCTGPFVPASWWSFVNHANPHPIADLVRSHTKGIIVVGLSRAYAPLVQDDLLNLADRERARVRIVGLSIAHELPEPLRPLVLPYDSRLDGPDSPSRGTRSDFA